MNINRTVLMGLLNEASDRVGIAKKYREITATLDRGLDTISFIAHVDPGRFVGWNIKIEYPIVSASEMVTETLNLKIPSSCSDIWSIDWLTNQIRELFPVQREPDLNITILNNIFKSTLRPHDD